MPPAASKHYEASVRYFLSWAQQQGVVPTQVRYADLLLFLQHCRKQGHSPGTQRGHTTALRHLFRMLRRQRKMDYNPAEGLLIKRRTKRLPHDLLEINEIHQLYQDYPNNGLRKLLLSTVVFQALRREEIGLLCFDHLYLKNQ